MHLKDVSKRIDKLVHDPNLIVDDTPALTEECRERISKSLNASVSSKEP